MEGFLGGLALAIITSLAWLAYRHPKGYDKALGYLLLFLFCGAVCMTAFGFGITVGVGLIYRFVPIADRAAADLAIRSVNVPFWPLSSSRPRSSATSCYSDRCQRSA